MRDHRATQEERHSPAYAPYILRCKGFILLVFVLYLKNGVGPDGENLVTLKRMVQLARTKGIGVFYVGDWNFPQNFLKITLIFELYP